MPQVPLVAVRALHDDVIAPLAAAAYGDNRAVHGAPYRAIERRCDVDALMQTCSRGGRVMLGFTLLIVAIGLLHLWMHYTDFGA